jgi:hypothetical protein
MKPVTEGGRQEERTLDKKDKMTHCVIEAREGQWYVTPIKKSS